MSSVTNTSICVWAIVEYSEGEAHHFRRDLRATRPGLDRGGISGLLPGDLFDQIWLDVWSFFSSFAIKSETK